MMKKPASILALIAFALIVPLTIHAQDTGELETFDDAASVIEPRDTTVGPVGITDELRWAHSIVTDIMIDAALTRTNVDNVDEEVYLEGTWVDEEKQHLVVLLDSVYAFDPIDVEDLQEELGLGIIPIEIVYGFFEAEASSSSQPCPRGATPLTCHFWDRYVSICTSNPNTGQCRDFAGVITRAGYALPAASGAVSVDTDRDGINDDMDQCDTRPETFNGYQDTDGCPDTPPAPPPRPPITPTSTIVPAGAIIFQDDFERGLGKWVVTGQQEWQAGQLDESKTIPGYTTSNQVAEADDCDDYACVLSLKSSIDLSGYDSATLEFDRFVDRSLDSGEYLAVSIGNNGAYREIFRWSDGSGDDDKWNHQTVNLASYLRSGFNIKFSTEESSSSEDVAVDNIKIRGVQQVECSLVVTASAQIGGPVKASWNSCEGAKKYKVYASENGGSRTYLGATTSTTYTYSGADEGERYVISVKALQSDYSYTGYFHSNQVTVPTSDRTAPVITVPENIIVNTNETSAIVTYDVTAYDRKDGSVSVSCNPPSASSFGLGETTVTCRARDAAGNSATETFTITVNQVGCIDDQHLQSGILCYLKTTFGRLIGGDGIHLRGNPVRDDGAVRTDFGKAHASIGLVVDTDNNEIGGISASHWSSTSLLANSVPYIDSIVGPIFVGDFTIDTNVFENRPGQSADAVFFEITNSDITPHINKIRYGIVDYSVTKFGGYNDLSRGSEIKISGLMTEGVGPLLYYNATVNIDTYTLINQGLANYPSASGDSGSPIFVNLDNNNVQILGTHVGLGCATKSDPDPPDYLICKSSGSKLLKVFSPWENVVSELGITVKP